MWDDEYCMVEHWPHREITGLLKHNLFSRDNEGRITFPSGAGPDVELSDVFFGNWTSSARLWVVNG